MITLSHDEVSRSSRLVGILLLPSPVWCLIVSISMSRRDWTAILTLVLPRQVRSDQLLQTGKVFEWRYYGIQSGKHRIKCIQREYSNRIDRNRTFRLNKHT